MAMARHVLPQINVMLADPSSSAYEEARRAVEQATTCEQALDRLRVLENQSADVVAESRAVLAALPTEVDSVILGVLRDGFAGQKPMKLLWQEDTSGAAPAITHGVTEIDGRLEIEFFAPDGARF
jgi:hypothetical protein